MEAADSRAESVGGHHGGSHRPDADDGDVGRGEVLQDEGQDEARLPALKRRRGSIRRHVPV